MQGLEKVPSFSSLIMTRNYNVAIARDTICACVIGGWLRF